MARDGAEREVKGRRVSSQAAAGRSRGVGGRTPSGGGGWSASQAAGDV